MFVEVGVEDALADAVVGDNRGVEVGVAGPVVAVGFGVDDVAEGAVFGDFGFEFEGVAGLLGAVNHHDAFGGDHEAVIAAPDLGFGKDAGSKLLHNFTLPLIRLDRR